MRWLRLLPSRLRRWWELRALGCTCRPWENTGGVHARACSAWEPDGEWLR